MNNCFPFTPYANPVNALAVDPHRNRLSADIDNGSMGGYYAYVNNCWQQISSGNKYENGTAECSLLYFHPTNPSIIYSAFQKSMDGGMTWQDYWDTYLTHVPWLQDSLQYQLQILFIVL